MSETTSARLVPIAELNQLAPGEFAEALRPLFEAAGPLAHALFLQRPFGSYADLLESAESIVRRLSTAEQIEVVNAHPRIGESEASVRNSSTLSYREQGYDGESALPADEVRRVYEALADLNRAYEQRFGFRFVVFVNGRPKSEIVKVLEQRLGNPAEEELQTALRAMFLIAHNRSRLLRCGSVA